MADETTATPPAEDKGGGVDATKLIEQNTKLSSELTEAQKTIDSLRNQVGSLETANKQANEKLTGIEAQFKQTQKDLDARSGELTNWQTQHSQLNEQLGAIQSERDALQRQAEVFSLISTEYPGAVDMYKEVADLAKSGANMETIEKLLGKHTSKLQETSQNAAANAVSSFAAGGTAASHSKAQPAQTGPKSKEEAWAKMQSLEPGTQEYIQLANFVWNADVNGSNTPA